MLGGADRALVLQRLRVQAYCGELNPTFIGLLADSVWRGAALHEIKVEALQWIP